MVMCDRVETSSSRVLSLISDLFEVIPDDSMMVVLANREGSLWTSHPQEVEALNIEPRQWQLIMERLDDGDDPVVVCGNDFQVVGAQLSNTCWEYRYVMVLLSCRSADALFQHMGLVEMVINQIDLMMSYADSEMVCV